MIDEVGKGRWAINLKEDDPKPLPWHETLRELQQLETIRDFLFEKYPDMKGVDVDDAVIGIVNWLEQQLLRYER